MVSKGSMADYFHTGSDTESEGDPPLSSDKQVVAILNLRSAAPPSLPVLERYAFATANAVRNHIVSIPGGRRSPPQRMALTLSCDAHTVTEWVQSHQGSYPDCTMRAALLLAMSPSRTTIWASKKVGGCPKLSMNGPKNGLWIIRGLSLNLRMHAFVRDEVYHVYEALRHRKVLPQARRTRRVYACGTEVETLEVAVLLVVFQRSARYFGTHRYLHVLK